MIGALIATWFLVGLLISVVGMGLTMTTHEDTGDMLVQMGLFVMGSAFVTGLAVGIVALWVEKPWLT